MNISHYPCDGNNGRVLADHGSNQSKHLQPDYFLPSSHSESYYSKNYVGNFNLNLKSKSSKISRVASVMLLSLSFLATAVEVKAKNLNLESTVSYAAQSPQSPQSPQQQPKKKPLLKRVAHKVSKHLRFSGVSQSERKPEITDLELKELDAAEYGEFIKETIERGTIGAYQKSELAEALRQSLALREKTLERRRAEDIFSKEPIYSNPMDTMSIASSSSTEYEEPSDPDTEIGEAFETEFSTSKMQQRFEPTASPLSAYSSFSSSTPIDTRDIKLKQEELEAIELLDQTIENSNEVRFQGGYDTDISNCSSNDTSIIEYDTEVEIRAYENVPLPSRSKKLRTSKARNASSAGAGARYSYRDIDQGLAAFQSDTDFSDEWSDASSLSSIDGYDTVYMSSSSEYSNDSSEEDDVLFPPPPTEEELAELDKLAEVSNPEQTLVTPTASISSEMQEESEYHGDSDILTKETVSEDGIQNSITEADAAPSNEHYVQDTSMDKEELLKKAAMAAASHNQARQASKIASHQIRHRIFAKELVTVTVAAGDDETDDAAENTYGYYSIWSSGTLGSNKQKSKAGSNSYSTKVSGGTIGADISLENDQLVGASFSKFSSRVKQQNKSASKANRYDTQILSLYGLSPVSRNMSLSAIGSAGLSKSTKAHLKLLSLELHLNYKIALPQNITLIPHIGFNYEYEKAKACQEQIASNLSIERKKKSYQAFNTEIGSRVIFAPIKLNASGTSNVILSNTILTPTVHFSVERRIGSRGGHSPYSVSYQGIGAGAISAIDQEVGTSSIVINPQHQKTSFNAGIGLIASHQNIKLELLYDHTRQKRFKAHQGVLKLQVSL